MNLFLSPLLTLIFALPLSATLCSAGEIRTNAAVFPSSPAWLTPSKVNKAVDSVQRVMEWDIRKVTVYFHNDQASFQKLHGYDSSVQAFSKKQEGTIHLGPRVDRDNFDPIFSHELVHIILYQKYKEAVPHWLEEGLANYVSKKGKVDYKWLSSQSQVPVRSLVHPFIQSAVSPRYHYMASTALVEMIASHCPLSDLLQLAVGVGLEKYLGTLCEIQDLDLEFQKWLKKKSK